MTMNDMPMKDEMPEMTTYGTPPEGMEDQCCAMCEGKTADELEQIGAYFSKKSSEMRSGMAKNITYDKFLTLCEGDRLTDSTEEEEE